MVGPTESTFKVNVMPELREVDLSRVRVPDVRVTSIHTEEQRALLRSTIQAVGTVQDIVVRDLGDGSYELVAGKGRLEELMAMGLSTYPVKVIQADERLGLVMNIIENLARGSYDYISVAMAVRKLRSMGSSWEELEEIFPWRRRWIEFLEDLQDLPDDVVEALRAGKLTPTHVQYALNLPTPPEVHDGLRTAINLGWDTGTFKVFVQNRVDQLERARKEAESAGVEPEIPPANPAELIAYGQCLICGYKKPRQDLTTQIVCQGCQDLARYVTSQLGPPEDAIQTMYSALQAYFGQPQPGPGPQPGSTAGPARE